MLTSDKIIDFLTALQESCRVCRHKERQPRVDGPCGGSAQNIRCPFQGLYHFANECQAPELNLVLSRFTGFTKKDADHKD